MLNKRKTSAALAFILLFLSFTALKANARGNEYDAVCDRLENKFQAKKMNIPFMWVARFAVGFVRPAGVKSFKVTVYKDLKFSRDTLDVEMRSVMREAFSAEWSPILRIRSKNGEQVYMNMRESGTNVKILLVSIDNENQATVVRAKFSPEKLSDFINNPKIFGISLEDKNQEANVEEKNEND